MTFFRKVFWMFKRGRKEDDLRDELAFHLEEEGGSAEARRELGNVTLIAEDTRAAWSWMWLEQFLQDLRYAARTMLQNKAFTALAALSLALGIGANTAIFSFMDALLMRSLPVRDPQSLAVLNWNMKPGPMRESVMLGMSGSTWDNGGLEEAGIFPYPAFEFLHANNQAFSTLFAYKPGGTLNLTFRGESSVIQSEYVSGEYFRGLDLPPAAGRLVAPEDDRFGVEPVAVLSETCAQTHFGGAANAIGASILLNNVAATVIGVTPPEFFGVDPGRSPCIYLPLHSNVAVEAAMPYTETAATYHDDHYYWIEIMGRLRPGVTREQAQAVIAPQFAQWVTPTAQNDKARARIPILTLKDGAAGLENLRRDYSKPLYVLIAMVGLILAIACANVANLLLARATARRREIALRLSVGAGRMRIVRQLLTESVALSMLGGAGGILLAIWGVKFLTATLATANGRSLEAQVNWHVLAIAAVLSVATGIIFGLLPAIHSTHVDLAGSLKEAQASQRRRRFASLSVSHLLIAGQITMAVVMLIGAGLFVRTLHNVGSIELGFNRENILLFQLDARKAGHKDPELSQFYAQLREKFAAIPGIRGATLSISPLLEAGHGTSIHPPGQETNRDTRYLTIGADFFSTMQIPIVAGRATDARDHAGSAPVVVISPRFAKIHFGDANPLGQHLLIGGGKSERDAVIVGIAKEAHYGPPRDAVPPVVYIPFDQGSPEPRWMTYELRTAGDPMVYANAVREIVRQADSRVPVTDLKSQTAELDEQIGQEIMFAKLCTLFALLALTIACVGLYGTMSYSIARRTSEIGIRMALGAPRPRVVWMVMREILLLAIAGLAISAVISMYASSYVADFLFQMKPNDPIALSGAVAVLLVAALIATFVPARRASRIDPMVALRHE